MLRPSSATAADEAINLEEGLGSGIIVVRNGGGSSSFRVEGKEKLQKRKAKLVA